MYCVMCGLTISDTGKKSSDIITNPFKSEPRLLIINDIEIVLRSYAITYATIQMFEAIDNKAKVIKLLNLSQAGLPSKITSITNTITYDTSLRLSTQVLDAEMWSRQLPHDKHHMVIRNNSHTTAGSNTNFYIFAPTEMELADALYIKLKEISKIHMIPQWAPMLLNLVGNDHYMDKMKTHGLVIAYRCNVDLIRLNADINRLLQEHKLPLPEAP